VMASRLAGCAVHAVLWGHGSTRTLMHMVNVSVRNACETYTDFVHLYLGPAGPTAFWKVGERPADSEDEESDSEDSFWVAA
jgi:hypothetical protein